jgi:hypothetical protein
MKYYRQLTALIFVSYCFGNILNAQTPSLQALAVEWAEFIPTPQLGYYARVVNEHELPNCEIQPLTPTLRDWRSPTFRSQIASLNPQILRFPAGTAANFWYWEDETVMIVGDNGLPRSLQICEASLLDVPESKDIGCPGTLFNFNADKFESIVRKSSTTLQSYKEAMYQFRNVDGLNVHEMFVLGPIDPFYYVGSPQLEYETVGFTAAQKRERIGQRAYQRMVKQLNKILEVYCGNCSSYNGDFDFEVGNEVFLAKYGRFFPFESCFSLPTDQNCDQCRTDVDFYADICEAIIPLIKSKFPNAKIAVVGSRVSVSGKQWTQTLINRFGPGTTNEIDGLAVHFYAPPFPQETLSTPLCQGLPGTFNIANLLHYPFKVMSDFYISKACNIMANSGLEVWASEFNSLDMKLSCSEFFGVTTPESEPLFYLDNWVHTLNVLGQFNSMMAYNIATPDPWLNASGGVPFPKLVMHSMYGNPHASAMMGDGTLTGAGVAATTLLDLITEADQMKRVIIAPPANIAIQPDGSWLPNVAAGAVLPYHYVLSETLPAGGTQQTPVFDIYGWLFKGPTSYKMIIVNLRNAQLNTNLANIPGFEGQIFGSTHHVAPSDLLTQITDGLNSPFVVNSTFASVNGQLTLPPYSFTIINGTVPPDCSGASQTSNSCPCNPPLFNYTHFNSDFGVWTPAGPGSLRVPAQPGYPAQVGSHLLRLRGNSSTGFVSTIPTPAESCSKMKITFDYAGFAMTSANDKLMVQVSTNGGSNFTTLRELIYGVDFQNGIPAVLNLTYLGPFSANFILRIRSATTAGGKDFFIDNIRIFACIESSAAAIIPFQEIETESVEVNQRIEPEMQVYPNPSSTDLNILIKDLPQQTAHYTFINGAGQMVDSGVLSLSESQSYHNIPVTHLAEGLYTLLVYAGNSKLTKKFIIQRR